MDWFIASAHAQGTAAPQGGGLLPILWMVALIVFFYFFLIRPQQKRAKEQRELVAALKKGDEVITTGGVLGKLTDVGENFVTLQIADGVEIKLQKQAIANVVPKGTVGKA
ncbi:MAG: preprotein translocase subunit YajC [Gammaproteobacteria bacterium]|nr:preprotein translocase subunit YajC [Gammaproteobacteria bacterium]